MSAPSISTTLTARDSRPSFKPAARWSRASAVDAAAVQLLATELRLPEAVCRLLAARGHAEPEAARRFLRPRLEQLHAPDTLLDLVRATERIVHAIRHGETIFVHGDYDVDGMSSTAILVRVLRALGAATVVPFVPNRLTDGYDLGPAGVRAAIAAQSTLVITCDCGTSAHEAVTALNAARIDVIITDHHLPSGPLPDAFAVVNPRRPGCTSLDKDLAAVGVAYKLALSLCDACGVSPAVAHRQLDLVALATVADVAPLRGENRVLVRYGLKLMAETQNVGLRALIRSSGLDGKPLTAGRIGFVLAPRLNAAGRIGDAKRGLALLLTDREDEANAIARELEELNRHRQDMDKAVLETAMRQVERLDTGDRFSFVLASEGWHAGVIGIVASRIVEQTARPVILIAIEDGIGKGSGRSIPAFDLHGALVQCRDHFVRFGGHRAAAGLTMSAERVASFADAFEATAHSALTADDLVPEVRIDLEIPLDDVREELESLVRHFEPFGIGNPAPMFSCTGVRIMGPTRRVGADGLRLTLVRAQGAIDALGWGMAPRAHELAVGRTVDLAFRVERDEYRGASQLQLRLVDFRA